MALGDSFWLAEAASLYDILVEWLTRAALKAVQNGIEQITGTGVEIDPPIDWNLLNKSAEEWARQYSYNLVKDINDTSRAVLQESIADWIRSGEPLDDLIDLLEQSYPKVRAQAISVTEVTRAFAEGNLRAWKASGVVKGVRWMTVEDDDVDEPCIVNAEAGVVALGQAFPSGDEMPPAHVGCRCFLQPVITGVEE